MRRAVIAAAAVGVILALVYLLEARRYPWGVPAQPGPGLYPTLVGILMLVSSLGVVVEAASGRGTGRVGWPAGRDLWRLLAILAPTAGYAVLLPYLGHPLAAALLTLVVLHAMGLRRWWVKIGVALAVGLGSQYVFAALLGVPLPTGFWSR
jgi:putative tricarboxylic transport membrane protein